LPFSDRHLGWANSCEIIKADYNAVMFFDLERVNVYWHLSREWASGLLAGGAGQSRRIVFSAHFREILPDRLRDDYEKKFWDGFVPMWGSNTSLTFEY
jgi:hypothetical protein